jgi:hypothetical protein
VLAEAVVTTKKSSRLLLLNHREHFFTAAMITALSPADFWQSTNAEKPDGTEVHVLPGGLGGAPDAGASPNDAAAGGGAAAGGDAAAGGGAAAGAATAVPEATVVVFLAVLQVICALCAGPGDVVKLAGLAVPAALALFKVVGPFAGPVTDAAARQQRRDNVAAVLGSLEIAVRARATGDAAEYVSPLFQVLAHGVRQGRQRHVVHYFDVLREHGEVHEQGHRNTCRLHAEVFQGLQWDKKWVAQCEALLAQAQGELASFVAGTPASFDTTSDRRAHHAEVTELQTRVATLEKNLKDATAAQTKRQRDVDQDAAARSRHFEHAWAWSVVLAGAVAPQFAGEGASVRKAKRKKSSV